MKRNALKLYITLLATHLYYMIYIITNGAIARKNIDKKWDASQFRTIEMPGLIIHI